MKSKRVLVVDDSDPCCRISRIALTRVGYEVSTASSVPEALKILSTVTPDALVCDLLLGRRGTGLEVVAAARASAPGMFCVAVTGCPMDGIREDAISGGFDAFLYKPFLPADLVALLP